MRRRPQTIAFFCAALAAALLCGCVRTYHAVQVTYDLALPSGEHVTIKDAHGDSFTDVSGVKRHIYYIMYETSHDIDDIAALGMEALRVWAAYKPQIVGVDYDTCVVTPVKQDAAGSESGHPFYLKRDPDGTWVLQQ